MPYVKPGVGKPVIGMPYVKPGVGKPVIGVLQVLQDFVPTWHHN
jgi:hypothetical protein